jgi:hypothetical protein
LRAVSTSRDRHAMPSTWMIACDLSMLVVIVLTIWAASIVQGGSAYVLRFPACTERSSVLHDFQGPAPWMICQCGPHVAHRQSGFVDSRIQTLHWELHLSFCAYRQARQLTSAKHRHTDNRPTYSSKFSASRQTGLQDITCLEIFTPRCS